MCWPWTREIPCLSLPLYKKKRLSCRVLVCFVKHFEILRWKILQKWVCFFFFLIEQTIQKRSRASLGGLLCEALCLWSHRTRTNMWQGALCSFTFDSTAGDTQWYSACWGSASQSISKVKVFLCHLFLAWSLPCCGAFLWSVKWEQLGSPAAVTGIPLMVFQRCQAGEVYQSHGEVAVQRCCWRNELMLLSPLPAHRPFHLFRFRAKRWKWSQCRCLQDVAWRQRTI